MSALRLRTLSPHRKTLLASISYQEASPHCTLKQRSGAVSYNAHSHKATAGLQTSCGCQASGPQTTYIQSTSPLRKEVGGQKGGVGRGRGRGVQQQSVSKVLQQVHLSSWAKGSLSSIFNGLGAFAAGAPNRLVEEFGRLVGRSGQKVVEKKEEKDGGKVQVVEPVAEDSTSKPCTPAKDTENSTMAEWQREQHTFEKAMEDTHQSITSYYHAYTTPHYLPVKETATHSKTNGEEEVKWNVFRKIPLPFLDSPTTVNKKPIIRKDFVSRSAIESRTRALVAALKTASSYTSKISRTQDLCRHLKQYPSGRHEATECKAVPLLLQMMQAGDQELKEEGREALALLGYSNPVQGRGIRILTLDGGGTRGLLSIQCLKKMEELSGRRIYQLFDYVCGVSTGALIAAMVVLYRLPLEECHRLYTEFSRQMFSRSRVMGTGGLVWNHAFYDSDQWEKILQAEIGHKTMIEFSRDEMVPKMSAVSTLINTPRMKNFMFRNYNLPPSTYSQYPGSCNHELWQVIRASSAAPGYYEDFPLGDYVHSDGGLSTNNPTALAIHESRLLWPNEKLQCVVSLGTGRFEPIMEVSSISKVTLKEKVNKIVDSATDTEGVHVMMMDLMPPDTYFRFNPYLSEELQLDEIRQDRLDSMQRDTTMYMRKNELKLNKAVETLKQGRMAHQQAMDWVKLKADSIL